MGFVVALSPDDENQKEEGKDYKDELVCDDLTDGDDWVPVISKKVTDGEEKNGPNDSSGVGK